LRKSAEWKESRASKVTDEKSNFFEWAKLRSPALASQPSTCATREERSYDSPVQPLPPLCVATGIGRFGKSTSTIERLDDVFALDKCRDIYK
jgi:hypothetical protein